MHVWQWKLDSNLPGRLGQIGDWLYRSEELVNSELAAIDDNNPEETAKNIRRSLDKIIVKQQLFIIYNLTSKIKAGRY